MKFFLVFIICFSCILRCSCQENIKYKYKEKLANFLYDKGELSYKDTTYFNGFLKNVNVNFISEMDTCLKVKLYSVRMDSRIHSKTFFFAFDESGITFLDFLDFADLLKYLGNALSNKCSVGQKEKIRICEYLLDAQKNKSKGYRN